MFNKKDEEIIDSVDLAEPKKDGKVSVTPLKDFVIHHNEVKIELQEGVECEVPAIFIDNLKTEKVI